jgi:hypothetical protein
MTAAGARDAACRPAREMPFPVTDAHGPSWVERP